MSSKTTDEPQALAKLSADSLLAKVSDSKWTAQPLNLLNVKESAWDLFLVYSPLATLAPGDVHFRIVEFLCMYGSVRELVLAIRERASDTAEDEDVILTRAISILHPRMENLINSSLSEILPNLMQSELTNPLQAIEALEKLTAQVPLSAKNTVIRDCLLRILSFHPAVLNDRNSPEATWMIQTLNVSVFSHPAELYLIQIQTPKTFPSTELIEDFMKSAHAHPEVFRSLQSLSEQFEVASSHMCAFEIICTHAVPITATCPDPVVRHEGLKLLKMLIPSLPPGSQRDFYRGILSPELNLWGEPIVIATVGELLPRSVLRGLPELDAILLDHREDIFRPPEWEERTEQHVVDDQIKLCIVAAGFMYKLSKQRPELFAQLDADWIKSWRDNSALIKNSLDRELVLHALKRLP